MILYPSLDIFEGKVVRLEKGDFSRVTHFDRTPEEWISEFEAAGARHLHLVDLSGAQEPKNRQVKKLTALLRSTKLQVQVGGGVRDLAGAADYLSSGAARVVIGSLALTQPKIFSDILKKFSPEKICVALDVTVENNVPVVRTHGWSRSSGKTALQVISDLRSRGVRRFLCTDISKDGMMTGPGFGLYELLRENFPELEFQASGGVSTVEDLARLRKLGLHSTVLGRAVLSEKIKLQEIFP